jgi:hypothetical protein
MLHNFFYIFFSLLWVIFIKKDCLMKYIFIVKLFDTQRFEFLHQEQKQTNSS